ncbi:MAG: Ig-like domain-containing protein [Eubacterium sp.]|nr:Ig-like domain-containing protein [Eubacterium sp.]
MERIKNRKKEHIKEHKKKYLLAALLAIVSFAAVSLMPAGNIYTAKASGVGSAGSSAEDTPQGPQYSEDGSQIIYTNLYFGSYPQSEVMPDDLTPAIQNAAYDSYGDAWVDGVKYRRSRQADANNKEQFGDSEYRYFKWERIRWRVLANDGQTLYVMADAGLDCRSYHEMGTAVTWADSSLRKWLGGAFYRTAFSDSERQAIVQMTLDNAAYAAAGADSSTQDTVYIPSMEEMADRNYGFSASVQNPSPCRQIPASDYAYAMGARLGGEDGTGQQYCWWWLRSPAAEEANPFRYAALINHAGSFSMYGLVENKYRAVVPVLHIRLDSDVWKRADDASSGFGGGESAAEPLTVSAPQMQRSQNVAAFDVQASGGLTSEYDYQWYYAPSDTGSGHPLSESDYQSIVWQGKALYIDLKADDVPDGLYLYCAVSDGRTTVESSRVWFSKKKTSQTITYNQGSIQNGQLEYGAAFSLKAKSNGASSTISYKSSNPNVLSVSASGRLKAKNYGKATITITASDSPTDEYGKTTKKIALTVVPKQVQVKKIVRTRNSQGRLESVYVEWKKDKTVDGCQYSIAYNQNYTNSTNGEKAGTDNFMRLKYLDVSKEKLYIRVRTYKKAGKKTYYGKWSKSYMLAIS